MKRFLFATLFVACTTLFFGACSSENSEFPFVGYWRSDDGSILYIDDEITEGEDCMKGHGYCEYSGGKGWSYDSCSFTQEDEHSWNFYVKVPDDGKLLFIYDGVEDVFYRASESQAFHKDPSLAKILGKKIAKIKQSRLGLDEYETPSILAGAWRAEDGSVIYISDVIEDLFYAGEFKGYIYYAYGKDNGTCTECKFIEYYYDTPRYASRKWGIRLIDEDGTEKEMFKCFEVDSMTFIGSERAAFTKVSSVPNSIKRQLNKFVKQKEGEKPKNKFSWIYGEWQSDVKSIIIEEPNKLYYKGSWYEFEIVDYQLQALGIRLHLNPEEKIISQTLLHNGVSYEYYKKVSDTQIRARGESAKTNKEQQFVANDVDVPDFKNAQSVMTFLMGHVFKSNESGIELTFKGNAVYANGIAITAAPQVTDFSSDEATLRAHSPISNTTYEFWLVRTDDSYLIKSMTLPSHKNVENYYMIR